MTRFSANLLYSGGGCGTSTISISHASVCATTSGGGHGAAKGISDALVQDLEHDQRRAVDAVGLGVVQVRAGVRVHDVPGGDELAQELIGRKRTRLVLALPAVDRALGEEARIAQIDPLTFQAMLCLLYTSPRPRD